ncbi:hypothetical protein [Solibacillus sp. FSL K6-1523]|uniref:hypothetical protein n=1 Tax=Solibacillus sp. FSL K6-1523 TaxID=2921471 RepID=UPI0030FAE7FB
MRLIVSILGVLALLQIGSSWYAKSKEIEPIVLAVDYDEDYRSLASSFLNNLHETNVIAWIEINGRQFQPYEYFQPFFTNLPQQIQDNYANYTYYAIRNKEFRLSDEDHTFLQQQKTGAIVTVHFINGHIKTYPLQVNERAKDQWVAFTSGGGSTTYALTNEVVKPFILEEITIDDETIHVDRLTIGGKTITYPLTEPIALQEGQIIHFVTTGGVSLHMNTQFPIWFSGKDADGMAVKEKIYGHTHTPPTTEMVDEWVKEAKQD